MQKVSAYVANDGSLHKDRKDAVRKNIENFLDDINPEGISSHTLAYSILANRNRLMSILSEADADEAA